MRARLFLALCARKKKFSPSKTRNGGLNRKNQNHPLANWGGVLPSLRVVGAKLARHRFIEMSEYSSFLTLLSEISIPLVSAR